jgi:hypothetical protein
VKLNKQIRPEEVITIVRLLNKQLGDTIDLRSQARLSYFNVKGSYTDGPGGKREEQETTFDVREQQ